jgi:hypothetical protein
MAFLREIATERRIPLEPEHVVGRALTCALRISAAFVSAQHALIRYDGQGWVLRDLASTNGTWLNGRRVPPGEELALRAGSRLAFGKADAEWEMVGDSPPAVMVIPLDDAPPIVIEGDLLPLPSADDPSVTIYRALGDSWMLEEGDAPPIPLAHLRVFHGAGLAYRFSCPGNVYATTRVESPPAAIHLDELAFELTVSRDEEHVRLRARCAARLLDFGERAYHYLLLTLARARLADAGDGVSTSTSGWLDIEALCRSSTPSQIGVDVFRNRKQLAESAVIDAPRIIERRPGQLRVGVSDLKVFRE